MFEPDVSLAVEVDKARFSTTAAGVRHLASWLAEAQVTLVVMEATGVYWKPVFYPLEDLFEEVWLVNAAHVRNVPGRKTDMSDAEWLADVAAHGMIRPSFVPPPPIRALRELTRYRKTQITARGIEIQRLEKVLQDAGIKLTSVASKVWSQSARAMIEALIAGEASPEVLAELSKGRMRPKIPALIEALEGTWDTHHSAVARQILAHIDFLDSSIEALTTEIGDRLHPYEAAITLLCTIPGISTTTAEVIVAETGADMSRFPTPASRESAGKRKPAGTRHGGQWLRIALVQSAKAASKTKDTYLAARYRNIARRRGPNKATVAVAHSITTAIWHMLSTGQPYQDLGPDHLQRRRNPEQRAQHLVRQLAELGYNATLEPAA